MKGGGKRELHLPIWTRQMYVKGSLRQIVFTNFYAGRRYSRILLHCPKDFYHHEFHGPEVLSVGMEFQCNYRLYDSETKI